VTDPAALAKRLQRVEDVQALHALKAEYAAAADAKYVPTGGRAPEFEAAADRQAACFAADAVWHGGPFGGTISGRDGLLAFFRNSPWRFTAHLYDAPAISVDGDAASARWRLWEIGTRAADGRTVLMVGTTEETYRRTPDGWKIASMRFSALHAVALDERPDALRCLIPAGETV
jgi:hypothetical protein